MTDIPIRDGDDALKVNWLELVIKDAKGQIAYRNSFVTDLPVNADNVADLAGAGRARWKIENETFNVLKTKGYNLEHNFGHGQNNLSATLAALNLVAFAIHTAAQITDDAWSLALKAAAPESSSSITCAPSPSSSYSPPGTPFSTPSLFKPQCSDPHKKSPK